MFSEGTKFPEPVQDTLVSHNWEYLRGTELPCPQSDSSGTLLLPSAILRFMTFCYRRSKGYSIIERDGTGFKLAVKETRPKSLFPRTGQVQASEAALPPGLRQGQWVSSSFQTSSATSSATVSRPPQQVSSPHTLVMECA